MKIYLAARYSRRDELCGYRALLEVKGHTVTSRWLNGNHQIDDQGLSAQAAETERVRFAAEDWEDLMAADCCISFTEIPRSERTRGGRHVEFGAALAAGKRCIVVGPRENVFHCLPQVEYFSTWQDLLASPALAVVVVSVYDQPGPADYLLNPEPIVAAQPVSVLIARIRAIARDHGYAVGVHGSLARDIDLIAIPWTAAATDPELLVGVIMRAIGYTAHGHRLSAPRPGGRRSILLMHPDATFQQTPKGTWTPPAIDLSVVSPAYTGGAIAIANERHRQISREDFDSEHDDRHADGSLAIAACCYAEMAACQALDSQRAEQTYGPGHQHWPWHTLWWKPRDARSNLVRAGALIAAEIDRLDRAALRGMGAVRQ